MTTMQLECFLAVAETLNFAKAANQLNVTQPAVTQQIRGLEEELNTQLFRRTTRMVQMTPEGYAFLDDARRILDMMHFTKKKFQEHIDGGRIHFCIGSHTYDELGMFAGVLRKMADKYPLLHPVFQVVPFQHLYKFLVEEMVDVIIAFQEKDEKESYGEYRELIKDPVVAVLPVGHPLTAKQYLTREDLAGERIALAALQRCPSKFRDIQHGFIKNRAMTDILFCDTFNAGILLVKAGFGVAVVPGLLVGNDPALRSIPIQGIEPMSYGAYYKSISGKPLLQMFLQLCKENFVSRV